jgi:hypothetical protein
VTGGCGVNAMRCCASASATGRFIGFTLTNGYAGMTTGHKDGSGGGARGGTYSNCVFTANTATMAGGNGGGSAYANLYNCVLRNNLGDYGGAMTQGNAYDCDMYDNTARSGGGACYVASCYDCLVSNNVAGYNGGAGNDVNFYNCAIVDNTTSGGWYGSATYSGNVISNCAIRGNSGALRYGSAGYGVSAADSVKFYNCLVTENHAAWGFAFENYVTLINCTIVSNTCGLTTKAAGLGEVAVYATNCIIAGNIRGGGVVSNYSAGVDMLTRCLTTPDPTGAAYDGGGNIAGDPGFANAASNDYHLAKASPAIEAGATVALTDDLDGVARPRNGDGAGPALHDIGCYEYVLPPRVGTVISIR